MPVYVTWSTAGLSVITESTVGMQVDGYANI